MEAAGMKHMGRMHEVLPTLLLMVLYLSEM
jgi:hypothetical protein